MSKGVQLSLVIHNHQPVGNFDHVIDQACDMAYLPFLRMALEHPHVRFGLHTSGCLWEWLEGHRPEYGQLVEQLVQRGQVELLGGGMYEPILPVLPERDALWQLNRFNGFLEQRFGAKPEGMWCPERVWEPHLPAVLAAAGLRYTLLDDHHFRSAALPDAVKTEYFLTSHAGSEIALLPISKKLRYTLPFKPVADTLEYLKELTQSVAHTPLVVFGDDGEKFGVWPETYEWVYEKGWLDELFCALGENSDWIELLLPGEVVKRRRPSGTVFIPCASYTEMGEWSRVDPDAAKDDPVGFWRNYFHKYPESYAMYRHGLDISERLHALRERGISDAALADAADDLGRSQCNCAYWHGVFGGLYLNYLRQAVSHHQLKAEQVLHQHEVLLGLATGPMQVAGGYRMWGGSIAVQADAMHGLSVTRIDDVPGAFCWSDVLARRREAYHVKLNEANMAAEQEHASIHDRVVVKEPGLQDKLVLDPHERLNFNTYFTNLDDPELLVRLPLAGERAVLRQFDDYDCSAEQINSTATSINGIVDHTTFRIRKTITMDSQSAAFEVRLLDGMPPEEDLSFVLEFNLTVLTDQSEDRYIEVDGDKRRLSDVLDGPGQTQLLLTDGWRKKRVRVSCAQSNRVISYPVYTVSSSEGGFERTYQGSCILIGCHSMALVNGIHCDLIFEDA
jgi:4-alpha-glucanotransferase